MAAYGHAGANMSVRKMGPAPFVTLGHLAWGAWQNDASLACENESS